MSLPWLQVPGTWRLCSTCKLSPWRKCTDTLAAALPRVPLDRLTLDGCRVSFHEQQADDRAIQLQDKWVQRLHA